MSRSRRHPHCRRTKDRSGAESSSVELDAHDPIIIIEAIHAAVRASPDNLASFDMRRVASALARFASGVTRFMDSATWTSPPGGSPRDRAAQAVSSVLAFHTTQLTEAAVAARLDIGVGTLSGALNQHTRHTFAEHLNLLRIVRALVLLAETDQKVGVIARACGYPQAGQLDAWFQRVVHVTPRRFRQLVNADRAAVHDFPTENLRRIPASH